MLRIPKLASGAPARFFFALCPPCVIIHKMRSEGIGFWRHTRLEIACAFEDFKIVRDVLIGTGIAVMTLGLQVWKHVISVADWQEHKEWWVLSFVLPYLAVLAGDALWRLAKAPWMLYRKTEREYSEELTRVKGQHEQELEEARKQKPPTQKLTIRSAKYGTGDINDVNVLDAVNSIPRDALVIPVDNNLVAGRPDPAPMQRKRLHVEYSYGESSLRTVERAESQPGAPSRLVLPEDTEIPRLSQALRTVTAAAISAEQVQRRLETALTEGDKKHREEMASLAKKVEADTRDWPGDWKLAEDGFRRYEGCSVRADWFSESLGPLEKWTITGDSPNRVRDIEASCVQAGRLLAVSPMSAQISSELQTCHSDVDRWLYFLKDRYGLEHVMTGQSKQGDKTYFSTGGTIFNLAAVSARACIECGAKSFRAKAR